MAKNKFLPLTLIAVGIAVILGVTLLFHAYTRADVDVINAAGDVVAAVGEVVGDWRSYEMTMYLGAQRIVVGAAGGVVALGILLFLVTQSKVTKSRDVMALAFIGLATLAVVGFLTVFYPCYDMMPPARLRPMRCVWTMRVLFGVAGAINVSAFLMLLSCSKGFVRGLNAAIIQLGVLFILVPTTLTGVCLAMRCVDGFRPFALVMGGVVVVLSLVNVFLLMRKEEDEHEAADNV